MADGPGIQMAGQRALASGQTLNKTLAMVAKFRQTDTKTPIVLMGYYNPIYIHGVTAFIADALKAGGRRFDRASICRPRRRFGALRSRARSRPQFHPADDAEPPTTAVCPRGAQKYLGLCLLRLDELPASPAQPSSRTRPSARRSSASRAIPPCRSPSASASRLQRTRSASVRDADGVVVGTALCNADAVAR